MSCMSNLEDTGKSGNNIWNSPAVPLNIHGGDPGRWC